MASGRNFRGVTEGLRTARAELDESAAGQVLSIQEQIEAIERGDFDAALRHARADVELEIFGPPQFKFISRARGSSEIRRAMEHNFGLLRDQTPQITNVIVQGDVVVMMGSERGVIAQTGAPYHVESVHRFTFDSGQLTHIRIIAADAGHGRNTGEH